MKSLIVNRNDLIMKIFDDNVLNKNELFVKHLLLRYIHHKNSSILDTEMMSIGGEKYVIIFWYQKRKTSLVKQFYSRGKWHFY